MSNITDIAGNIFNTKAQTIVNTVNCVGVMGKGIALVYKMRYPKMFDEYKGLCAQRQIGIGHSWLYKGESAKDPWVLNFPTKFHWKYPSKLEYVEKGLQEFVASYKAWGITSIAFPMLGTNNGGLDKDIVAQMMHQYLGQCDIPIEIYAYDPTAPDDMYEDFKRKWLSIPPDEIRLVTKIQQQKQIDIINQALQSDDVKSMIALLSYDGIGKTTMDKCFRVVRDYVPQPRLML